MDSGGMEMVEQKEPLLPATPAPLDQGHLSEVVIHQKVIGEDATKETTPVPVADATPLLLACKEGRAEEAKELLEAKDPALSMEDINMVDEEGETALTWAIQSKMSDVALHLMKRGVKCDVITDRKNTPLSLACMHRLPEVVEELLKEPEEEGPGLSLEHINTVDVTGQTALIRAIGRKMSDVALHLMKRGAKCDVINDIKYTPLSIACMHRLREVAEELLKGPEEGGPGLSLDHINTVSDGDGHTALTEAIYSQMSNVALRLMKRGAKCDVITDNKQTPLSLACMVSLTEVAWELVKGTEEGGPGLSLEHINTVSDGETALTWAINNWMSDNALQLIKRGAKCDVITNNKDTPLSLACHHHCDNNDNNEVAQELLKGPGEGGPGLSKDHINIVNDDSGTALLLAIGSKMSDVAIQLMKRGAKCDVINNKKDTPLSLACRHRLPEVAEELLKEMEEGFLSLEHINTVDDDGQTALSGAITYHMLGVMKKLIDQGAKCRPGYTPLYDACHFSFNEGALELLARKWHWTQLDTTGYNKDINTPGPDGKMPLEWAVRNNLSEVVVELLKKGANIQKNEKEVIEIKQEDFQAYLDESVTIDIRGEREAKSEEKLVLNYSFLTGEGEDQTNVLSSVLNLSTEHRELVKHPLVRAFLMMKWRKMVPIWIFWIFLKLFFLVDLVGFAVVIQSSNAKGAKNNETCDTMTNPLKLDIDWTGLTIAQISFTLLLVLFWLIEAAQFLSSFTAWKKEAKNWLQISILGGSTFVCVSMFQGSEHFYCIAKHVVATLLPMAYFEGLYEIGYHHKAAKYINLFNRVLWTFLQYFLAYVGLIICFAGGYAIMLQAPADPKEYPDTFWELVPKVFVMVTGEQEYMNIPFSNHTAFRVWEVLYYLVFLVFTVVVLLNLLNGLAVADARDMLEASDTDSLCHLLETAAFWDKKFMNEKKKDTESKHDKYGEVEEEKEELVNSCNNNNNNNLFNNIQQLIYCIINNYSKLKISWTKLRHWWQESHIPHCIKARMKWFFVLKFPNYNAEYFFSIYKGEKETYKSYAEREDKKFGVEFWSGVEEKDFTINQELKKMFLQIINARSIAKQEEKENEYLKNKEEQEEKEKELGKREKEQEKKEKEQEKKERCQEKEERKQILEMLQSMQRSK